MLTKVKLRQKPLADGKLSLYLEFYPPITDQVTGKKTRREFLQLHIWEKPKGSLHRQHIAYLERSEKKFIEYYEESFKDKPLAKTAIICAAMMPQYLWLATGGKSGLTSERLSSLKGRKIIVFPDIDAFKDW